MSTSLRKHPKKQKTWRSPIHHLGEFQIDHVAISYDYQKEIHDVQVRRGANIDSDHYLSRIKIKLTPKRKFKRKTPVIPKFDLHKIKDSKITEKWEEQHAEDWEKFQTKIIKTAKDLIPLRRKPKHPWWNQECENALEERRKAFQNYNCNKSEETQKKLFGIRKQTSKILRQLNENISMSSCSQSKKTLKTIIPMIFIRVLQTKSKVTHHRACAFENKTVNWP